MSKQFDFFLTIILVFYLRIGLVGGGGSLSLDDSPYMNTHFLAYYRSVAERLMMNDSFQEVYFSTRDNYTLNGLLRVHAHARATIIIFCGWVPGRKEGVASLIPMFSEHEFNLLLVDARGHGKSQGKRPWRTIKSLGIHESQDVIAAIEFLNRVVDKPIIIWGTCAGAFYAAHALVQLTEEKMIETYKIKGLIFDSGWASPVEVAWQTPVGFIKTSVHPRVQKMFINLYGVLFNRFLKPALEKESYRMSLLDKIHKISVPIFYIHSVNDIFANFSSVQQLYERTQSKCHWWIEGNAHATHQLKYKHEYRDHLLNFCNSIL